MNVGVSDVPAMLRAAEERRDAALGHLHDVSEELASGGPDYRAAAEAYFRAEHELYEAHVAWLEGRPPAAAPAVPALDDTAPTAHMRFIRWLVQSGRLSG